MDRRKSGVLITPGFLNPGKRQKRKATKKKREEQL